MGSYSYGQQVVSGIVMNENGEVVENVMVFDSLNYKSTMTDAQGRFDIEVGEKVAFLHFNHISYVTQKKHISDKNHLMIVLTIHQLNEVVIEAISSFQNKRNGQITINKAVVDVLPTIGGEVDYIKSIILFPGVSSGEEISKGITVRGGSIDQNLSHINGVQTSNTGHLFNLFSAVPATAVEDIQFYKGGVPAHLGNALASSMDIKLRKPKNQALQLELGVTNSKIAYENVFGKNNKSSFLLSGRTSYIDAFRKKAKQETLNDFSPYGFDTSGPNLHFGYTFFDLFGSVHFDLGSGFSLDGFGLYSYDINTYIHNKRYITHLKHDLVNATYGFSFNKEWNQHKICITGGLNENEIKRDENNLDFNAQKVLVKEETLFYQYGVKNMTSKLDYRFVDKDFTLEFGGFSYFKTYQPSDGYFNTYSYNPLLQRASKDSVISEAEEFNFWLIGAYIQSEFDIKKLNIFAGLRWSQFMTTPDIIYAWEPRLSLTYRLSSQTSLKGSFDYLTQFDHGLILSEAGLDNLIYIPSFDHIEPAKNMVYALGVSHRMMGDNLLLSSNVFYRKSWNLQKLALDGKDDIIGDSFADLIVGDGEGEAYGLEFQATFQRKTYLFNLSYTYSRSFRQFDNFNNNDLFHFSYDKPHELNLTGAIGVGGKSSFSFNFILSNGSRYSLPSGIVNSVFGSRPTLLYNGHYNEAQLPMYHRLDIGYDYAIDISDRWKGKVKLNIVNLYNHRNINFIEINPDDTKNYRVEGISYFPILPSISLNIRYE